MPPGSTLLTPVTVVENGTLPQQKVAIGSAGSLVETIIDCGIKGPAVIFVGAHPVRPAAKATEYPVLQAEFPLDLLEAA